MKGLRRLFLFLLFSILFISFAFYFYQICFTPNILVGKEPRELIIPDSASFKTVQQILHEGGYVQDLVSFSFLARLMKYDRQVRPGRYILNANMNNLEAIRYLRLGRQEPVMITFNNVRLITELAKNNTQHCHDIRSL